MRDTWHKTTEVYVVLYFQNGVYFYCTNPSSILLFFGIEALRKAATGCASTGLLVTFSSALVRLCCLSQARRTYHSHFLNCPSGISTVTSCACSLWVSSACKATKSELEQCVYKLHYMMMAPRSLMFQVRLVHVFLSVLFATWPRSKPPMSSTFCQVHVIRLQRGTAL